MSMSVNNLVGFDQSIYDSLKTSFTEATGKTENDFNSLLIAASQNGTLSFRESVDEIRDLLPAPQSSVSCSSFVALPSFGSSYLALITEISSEERRRNAEMRAMQTEEMVAKIQDQADTIREKAVAQLVTGIVTGTLSIAQGIASASITAKGIGENQKLADAARQQTIDMATGGGTQPLTGKAALNTLKEAENAATLARQQGDMMLNSKVQMFNSIMGGSSGILGSIGQCVTTMYDAELKESEASVERIRAQQQNLESLDESLKALIQKAISSQDAIQQNINQTRTKILG